MSQQTPTDGEVLLPPLVPRRRPRTASFTIYRGEPIKLDVAIFHDFLNQILETLTVDGVDIQARVFRDFRDAGSLISTKTKDSGDLVVRPGSSPARVEIQLKPEDVAEERTIYVAIYVNGRMVDLFGNEIQPSPSNL